MDKRNGQGVTIPKMGFWVILWEFFLTKKERELIFVSFYGRFLRITIPTMMTAMIMAMAAIIMVI
jgi:hypothetical protein